SRQELEGLSRRSRLESSQGRQREERHAGGKGRVGLSESDRLLADQVNGRFCEASRNVSLVFRDASQKRCCDLHFHHRLLVRFLFLVLGPWRVGAEEDPQLVQTPERDQQRTEADRVRG